MKSTTIAAIAAIVATAGALAQGTVNFASDPWSVPPSGARFYDWNGPLSGDAYYAQLYAAPEGGSVAPVGAPVHFLEGDFAGFFAGGTRIIDGVAPGADALIEVRAWATAGGSTYEEALAIGAIIAVGNPFTVTTGGAGQPPSLPANLIGMQSVLILPEPSVTALGALGAFALLLRRKRIKPGSAL